MFDTSHSQGATGMMHHCAAGVAPAVPAPPHSFSSHSDHHRRQFAEAEEVSCDNDREGRYDDELEGGAHGDDRGEGVVGGHSFCSHRHAYHNDVGDATVPFPVFNLNEKKSNRVDCFSKSDCCGVSSATNTAKDKEERTLIIMKDASTHGTHTNKSETVRERLATTQCTFSLAYMSTCGDDAEERTVPAPIVYMGLCTNQRHPHDTSLPPTSLLSPTFGFEMSPLHPLLQEPSRSHPQPTLNNTTLMESEGGGGGAAHAHHSDEAPYYEHGPICKRTCMCMRDDNHHSSTRIPQRCDRAMSAWSDSPSAAAEEATHFNDVVVPISFGQQLGASVGGGGREALWASVNPSTNPRQSSVVTPNRPPSRRSTSVARGRRRRSRKEKKRDGGRGFAASPFSSSTSLSPLSLSTSLSQCSPPSPHRASTLLLVTSPSLLKIKRSYRLFKQKMKETRRDNQNPTTIDKNDPQHTFLTPFRIDSVDVNQKNDRVEGDYHHENNTDDNPCVRNNPNNNDDDDDDEGGGNNDRCATPTLLYTKDTIKAGARIGSADCQTTLNATVPESKREESQVRRRLQFSSPDVSLVLPSGYEINAATNANEQTPLVLPISSHNDYDCYSSPEKKQIRCETMPPIRGKGCCQYPFSPLPVGAYEDKGKKETKNEPASRRHLSSTATRLCLSRPWPRYDEEGVGCDNPTFTPPTALTTTMAEDIENDSQTDFLMKAPRNALPTAPHLSYAHRGSSFSPLSKRAPHLFALNFKEPNPSENGAEKHTNENSICIDEGKNGSAAATAANFSVHYIPLSFTDAHGRRLVLRKRLTHAEVERALVGIRRSSTDECNEDVVVSTVAAAAACALAAKAKAHHRPRVTFGENLGLSANRSQLVPEGEERVCSELIEPPAELGKKNSKDLDTIDNDDDDSFDDVHNNKNVEDEDNNDGTETPLPINVSSSSPPAAYSSSSALSHTTETALLVAMDTYETRQSYLSAHYERVLATASQPRESFMTSADPAALSSLGLDVINSPSVSNNSNVALATTDLKYSTISSTSSGGNTFSMALTMTEILKAIPLSTDPQQSQSLYDECECCVLRGKAIFEEGKARDVSFLTQLRPPHVVVRESSSPSNSIHASSCDRFDVTRTCAVLGLENHQSASSEDAIKKRSECISLPCTYSSSSMQEDVEATVVASEKQFSGFTLANGKMIMVKSTTE